MVLAAPAALWWLLLVPLVIILYMLRARREPRIVPSALLWERATRDLVARLPMRKLERSVLLLLQILAISAVVLALARPLLVLPGLAADAVALVVRTGASMQATDEPPTRLAAAQREALALLSRLGPRQPAALVEAGARPALISDFTTDHAALAEAVRRLQATDAAGSDEAASALAASLRAGGRPGRVHLFGDHPPADPRIVWHRVGRGAPNTAISAASGRWDGQRTRLLVRTQAYGGTSSRVLAVSIDGRTIARRPVTLVPQKPQEFLFDLGDATGVARATLEGRDALPADDHAAVAAGREGLPRVLVIGEPNPVLDAVMAAVPTSSVVRPEGVAPSEWGAADLVVLDGVDPLPLPPGSYLLINTLGTNLPVQIEGEVNDQTIRAVVSTHPVMRLVDLRGVRVAAGLALRPQAGIALAEGDVPLVWAYEGRGIRAVVLPFPLARTDLPLHPAFPMLVANAMDWLAGGPQAVPGEAPIVSAGSWTRATLTGSDGTVRTIEARDGLFALPPLNRVGSYRLRTGGWERRWVVSTVDARESDLTVQARQAAPAAADIPQSAQVPISTWLLALAAVLMAGEWFLWARTVSRAPRRGLSR